MTGILLTEMLNINSNPKLITLTISVTGTSFFSFEFLPVNCLLGSWYCDLKYAFKVYQRMYKNEISDFIGCSSRT